MKEETNKRTIFEKLQNARVEFGEQELKKSGRNKYAGYDYFSLPDFIPAANVILNKQRITPVFNINTERATLELFDWDSENSIVFETPTADATTLNKQGKPSQLEIQSLGSQHTYLKRYLYQNMLEIVEADAIEIQSGNPDIEPKEIIKANNYEIKKIRELYKPDEIKTMLTRLKLKEITDLSKEQAKQMIAARPNEVINIEKI